MKQILFSVTKKDLDVTYYSGTGAGGQHRNKHMNSCRIIHRDSGAIATASDSRSKDTNTKRAFARLVKSDTFKKWHRIKCAELLADQEAIEKEVDRWMAEENILVETYDPNKEAHNENAK